MRSYFLAIAVTLFAVGSSQTVAAQSASTLSAAGNTQDRIALSSRPAASSSGRSAMRLACAPLMGVIYEPNGRPLVGATLLIKGTHDVYVTDSEGKFRLTDPVYQGQTLVVGAAGYTPQEIALNDCTLPRLVLEQAEGARFKRKGKRAGQVVRLNNRNTNLR